MPLFSPIPIYYEVEKVPIYEYQCDNCGHRLESIQKISDDPLVTCPQCENDSLRKLVSAASFRLKGTGWYVTDFRDKAKKDNGAKDKDGKPKKDENTKTADKTDSKPADGKSSDSNTSTKKEAGSSDST